MLNQPKILVCTDFSEASDKALKLADRLAKKTTGEVHLLHVAEIQYYLNWGAFRLRPQEMSKKFTELVFVDLMERMQEQVKRCGALAKSMVVFESNATRSIQHVVSELHIDLIVMGDRGATGIEQFFLGSLSRKVAASSNVPVLIAKNDDPIENIAALVNNDEDMPKIIDWGQEFSLLSSAQLWVISLYQNFPNLYHVEALEYSRPVMSALDENAETNMALIRTYIERCLSDKATKIKVMLTNEKNLADHLLEVVQDEDIQLVVLKRSRKSVMDKYILGSVSGRVLERFKGNILII